MLGGQLIDRLGARITYGIGVLSLGVGYLSTELLRAIGLSPQLASMLFAPIAMVMTSIGYATQYPIYRAIIEPRPEEVVPPPSPQSAPSPPES